MYTDPKRRSETLTYCDTLDNFCELVKQYGFEVKRTALYYRLLPRRVNSRAGQRHVAERTIKVKLAKPQEDDHGNHISKRFCLAEARQNKQFASLLGIYIRGPFIFHHPPLYHHFFWKPL